MGSSSARWLFLRSQELNYSGTHYFGSLVNLGEVISELRVPRRQDLPFGCGSHEALTQESLRNHVKMNGWKEMVQTRKGNLHQFCKSKGDVIIS